MNGQINAALLLFEKLSKFGQAPIVRNIQSMETQLFSMVFGKPHQVLQIGVLPVCRNNPGYPGVLQLQRRQGQSDTPVGPDNHPDAVF